MAPISAMPAVLAAHDVEPNEVLGRFGLTAEYFADPENLLPFSTVGKLFATCVDRTGLEDFGLRVGCAAGLSSLGTVGYLMRSAPDVGTALGKLAEFLHIHDGGAVVTLDASDGVACLAYTIIAPRVRSPGQIYDTALALGQNLMQELCGATWKASAVRLAHRRPRDVAPYRIHFGQLPAFESERSEFIFPAKILRQSIPTADPVLHRLMAVRAAEAAARDGADLAGKLRRIIRPLMGAEACTLERIAFRAGVAPRTLNRRLAAQGTTFRDLREEIRLEAACELLSLTRQPAFLVAETLGFSDASAFSRAFRRRMGMTPADWRRKSGERTALRNDGLPD